MPDNTSRREIQGRSSVGLPTKTISMRDTAKVFGGTPGKDYRREIQAMSSVGRLTKSIEERYREGLPVDVLQKNIEARYRKGLREEPNKKIEEIYRKGLRWDS